MLAGCGTGIQVYRKLQRWGIPFSTGILYKNDVDYHLAKRIAARIIAEEPFAGIGEEAFRAALAEVRGCRHVIDAGITNYDIDRRLLDLAEEAKKLNKRRDDIEELEGGNEGK